MSTVCVLLSVLDLFSYLESVTSPGVTQATALNIRSYGVSMTTLEEVFLKIGEVFRKIGEVFLKIGEVFLKIGELFLKIGEVFLKIGESSSK